MLNRAFIITSLVLFVAVTGLVVVLLLRWSQPTQVRIELAQPVRASFTLTFDPGGAYLPLFVSKQGARMGARAEPLDTGAAVELQVQNRATRKLSFTWRGTRQEIPIKSIALQSLFNRKHWSASQIAHDFVPQRDIETFEAQGDTLVIRPNGKKPTVKSQFNVAAEIDALERADDRVTIGLSLVALACVGALLWMQRGRVRDIVSWMQFIKSPDAVQLVTAALLVIGIARILIVILHDPMWQYANQGDWFRLQACFGISAAGDKPIPVEVLVGDPPAIYSARHPPYPHLCYLSSQSLLLGTTLALLRARILPGAPNAFDIRVMGFVNGIGLAIVGLGLTLLFARSSKWAALAAALVFALLLADPSNTLFFNSFYSEPISLMAVSAAVGLCIYLLAAARWNWVWVILLAWALLLLGLSKTQNYLMPLWITVVLGLLSQTRMQLWRERLRRGAMLGTLLGLSLLVVAIQGSIQERVGYMQAATILLTRHSFLGTWAVAATDPAEAVRFLGLPSECTPSMGTVGKKNLPEACRDGLLYASRLRLLSLVLHDPSTLARVLEQGIPLTRPWHFFLTTAVRQQWTGSNALALSPWWSWASWIDALPGDWYWGLILLATLGFAISVGVLTVAWFRRVPEEWQMLARAQSLSMAVCLYVLGASLLGDGYFGLNGHMFLAHVPLLLAIGIFIVMTARGTLAFRHILRHKSEVVSPIHKFM